MAALAAVAAPPPLGPGQGYASDGRVVAVARPGLWFATLVATLAAVAAPPPLVPGRATILDVWALGSAAGPLAGFSALCRSSVFGFGEGLGGAESLGLLADQ